MQKVAGSSPVSRSLPSDSTQLLPRPRSQVVRQRSAKPRFGGSNPPGASFNDLRARCATSAQHRARLLVCLGVLTVLAFLGSCDDRQGSVSPPDTLVVVGGAGQPAIV